MSFKQHPIVLFEYSMFKPMIYINYVYIFVLQIYNEDLLDLLASPEAREKDTVAIREDVNGIMVIMHNSIDSLSLNLESVQFVEQW